MEILNFSILKNPLNWVFVLIAVMTLVLIMHSIFRQSGNTDANG